MDHLSWRFSHWTAAEYWSGFTVRLNNNQSINDFSNWCIEAKAPVAVWPTMISCHCCLLMDQYLCWIFGGWEPSAPTLQPNMKEMVLLVHATLQWHNIGEKHSAFFMSLLLGHFTNRRLQREHCRLFLCCQVPAMAPAEPPLAPPCLPLLLLLPALTIHPHSSHHSNTAMKE